MARNLFPFLKWFPLIEKKSLKADLIAGLTGAVIVLPQGVAFAAIAGLPPEYGLYTAMVTPVVAALFGSSHHLISGPTTAISIVVFSAISQFANPGSPEFVKLALTLTFLAGLFQLTFGLAKLGTLVNFVSHTVVTGFTAGAAILIATSQIKHVLGLSLPRGESFVHTWIDIATQLPQVHASVVAIAAITLFVAIGSKKLWPGSPCLLLGMIAGSISCFLIKGPDHGVAMLGEIPAHLPPISCPDFSMSIVRQLTPEAFAIALLGLIEAVSISRSVAAKSMQRIDGNQEFIGQGLSNIAGCFFSSYAGSGSFTRSGINYSAGAKTPLSAIFASLSLMLLVLLIAPLTAWLPIASMGGVILIVAYNLIDFHHIKKILHISKSESTTLIVTFLSTLFLELEFAIYIGVFLSLVLFLSRTSTPDIVTLSPDPGKPSRQLTDTGKKSLVQCPCLKIVRIDRPIYFGSVNNIQNRLEEIIEKENVHNLLIVSEGINFIDLSGAEMLVQLATQLKKRDCGLYFSNMNRKVCNFVSETGLANRIGQQHIFDHKREAIAAIIAKPNHSCCKNCRSRIFKECKTLGHNDTGNPLRNPKAIDPAFSNGAPEAG